MTLRALAALGLLASVSAGALAAPATKPKTPTRSATTAPATPARGGSIIGGVRDTGQFLPDSAVLGRVNDRILTVGRFRDAYFASLYEYRPKADSLGRVEFLNSMVNKEVLGMTALAIGRPMGFEDRAIMREHTERVLANVTYQRFVTDSVHPTEAQLQETYQRRGWRLRLQHVVTASRASAERARAELVGGRITWPAAVKKYSIDSKDPDGEIGWRGYSQLEAPMARIVFAQAPGVYSPVIQDQQGFHVIRYVERKPAPLPAYRAVERMVRDEVSSVLADRYTERMRAMAREGAGIQYDQEAIAWASSQFGETAGMRSQPDGTMMVDVTPTMPELSSMDTARVLARWKGGQITLGGFMHEYMETPPIQRANVNDPGSLQAALDGLVLEPQIARIGIERGIDKDPMALALIEKRREQIAVEHLFGDSIQSRVWVSPAERKQYYQDHIKEFVSLRHVRYAAIVRHSKAGADSLVARLKAGEKPAAILLADSLAGFVSGSIQERPENERSGPFFKLLFEELRPGQSHVEGPDKQGDWLVLHLMDQDQSRQLPYEEVQTIVDESLQNQKAEAMLKAMLERRRKHYTIETRPELVMRIRLTDPVLDAR